MVNYACFACACGGAGCGLVYGVVSPQTMHAARSLKPSASSSGSVKRVDKGDPQVNSADHKLLHRGQCG